MSKLLSKLGPFKWSVHNLIAHPAGELVFIVGYCIRQRERAEKVSNWIHDITIPEHIRGQGRG